MKKLKKCAALLLCACMAFSVAACGEKDPGGDKPGPGPGPGPNPGPSEITANIDLYTSVNIIEQRALQTVAYAYEDMQYERGNDIKITLNNNTDPDAYTQNLRNMLSSSVSNPTIASTHSISEYYGTNKLLDLTGYLEEPNAYIEDNDAWMNALEQDAYRSYQSGGSMTVPGISYSAGYVVVFYNKAAMRYVTGKDASVSANGAVAADGTVDSSKVTWQWLLGALEAARKSEGNFTNPLGLSTSAQSCGEDGFNMLSQIVNMYLDQYFRDFIQTAHSQEGDYSYVGAIDDDWSYSATDPGIDLASNYTYNLNRVVDNYFNKADFAPTSARYTEVMQNLYDLMQYADDEASYNDIFSRFNETTIIYENKGGGGYKDMKLFYVEDLAYVRTYRDAFKTEAGGITTYPDAQKIASELGWFLLPAMPSTLEGVADNVRPQGGPLESFGVLSTGTTSKDEIAVDFLKFLTSPAGQASIYATYVSENNAPIVMRQLVKGVEVPDAIDYSTILSVAGDSASSPYLLFGKGTGMKTCTVGNSNTYVKSEVANILSSYFRGSDRNWSGAALYDAIKSGFSSYASKNNLIYTDYAKVASVTNALKNSPFNTTA